MAIILLNVSIRLNDCLILTRCSLEKEIIADRNCGVGLIIAANHVAVGLILYGVISGEGGGLLALLVFWALGQATLILAAKVYDLITPFHLSEVIEKGNVAVGAALAGVLLALGNIVRFAVQGTFVSWSSSLLSFAAVALLGLVLLPLVRLAIDRLIMTRPSDPGGHGPGGPQHRRRRHRGHALRVYLFPDRLVLLREPVIPRNSSCFGA